jgi:hypothetical protein
LFAIRKAGQRKTLSSQRKIWFGFQENVFFFIFHYTTKHRKILFRNSLSKKKLLSSKQTGPKFIAQVVAQSLSGMASTQHSFFF